MRILGLDIGEATIGMAVSDPSGIIAQGLDSIRRTVLHEDIDVIVQTAERHNIAEIVVGLPIRLSGEIGIQAQKVMEFAEHLKKKTEVPVVFWDERFSTATATRSLIEADMSRKKRKKVVDKVAATVILQAYLDSR